MGYMSAHNRNRKVNGRAAEKHCEHCDLPADDWALDHGKPGIVTTEDRFGAYSDNPDDYIPLCKSCHKAFDFPVTHCPQGHEYAGQNLIWDNNKRKCRTCVYARNAERRLRVGVTPEEHARKMELQRIRRSHRRGQTVSCECGKEVATEEIARHRKGKRHALLTGGQK